MPSFVQAALSGVNSASRPRAKVDNFMMASTHAARQQQPGRCFKEVFSIQLPLFQGTRWNFLKVPLSSVFACSLRQAKTRDTAPRILPWVGAHPAYSLRYRSRSHVVNENHYVPTQGQHRSSHSPCHLPRYRYPPNCPPCIHYLHYTTCISNTTPI
jgi:hypothetical protein